jgi:iron(III) transport system substrate-binding protein
MRTARAFPLAAALAGLTVAMTVPAAAQSVPAGYPADYEKVISAAKSEGKVSIYTSTDLSQAQDLIDAFKKAYPRIEVEYNDLGSNGTYNRVIAEAAANQVGGDIVWSSAMDLQVKLFIDGLFAPYASAEKANLPAWASHKNTLYGTSLEPIGMIYNSKAIKAESVPKTVGALIDFIKANGKLKGKVATFDPEKSGTGFLFHTNDVKVGVPFWDLAKAFGAANGKTYSSSGQMKESVVSGENLLAFNVIGSYAIDWAAASETLGVAFFSDNNAAFSRIMAIAKGAPHPNAARLFLDFTLSKAGQQALAGKGVPSVRSDTSGLNAKTLEQKIGGKVTPMTIDEGLAQYLEPMKRVEFMRQWKQSIGR